MLDIKDPRDFGEDLGRYIFLQKGKISFPEIRKAVQQFFAIFSTTLDFEDSEMREDLYLGVGIGYEYEKQAEDSI